MCGFFFGLNQPHSGRRYSYLMSFHSVFNILQPQVHTVSWSTITTTTTTTNKQTNKYIVMSTCAFIEVKYFTLDVTASLKVTANVFSFHFFPILWRIIWILVFVYYPRVICIDIFGWIDVIFDLWHTNFACKFSLLLLNCCPFNHFFVCLFLHFYLRLMYWFTYADHQSQKYFRIQKRSIIKIFYMHFLAARKPINHNSIVALANDHICY